MMEDRRRLRALFDLYRAALRRGRRWPGATAKWTVAVDFGNAPDRTSVVWTVPGDWQHDPVIEVEVIGPDGEVLPPLSGSGGGGGPYRTIAGGIGGGEQLTGKGGASLT